jgi:hypothetical protein
MLQEPQPLESEHLSIILPGRLYLGDLAAATDGSTLTAAGVTHVVDVANVMSCDPQHENGGCYTVAKEAGDWAGACPGVACKLLVMVDDEEGAGELLARHFNAVTAFIDGALCDARSDNRVFVHCVRGVSRSATLVVQYLMSSSSHRLTLRAALALTKKARPCIDLNVGFKRALMALEDRLHPGEKPSIVLKLASRKPVLSSGRGGGGRSRAAKEDADAFACTPTPTSTPTSSSGDCTSPLATSVDNGDPPVEATIAAAAGPSTS